MTTRLGCDPAGLRRAACGAGLISGGSDARTGRDRRGFFDTCAGQGEYAAVQLSRGARMPFDRPAVRWRLVKWLAADATGFDWRLCR